MKPNISCEIINDLLPNYIEGSLSEESRILVEIHMENCIECKKEFENMNSSIAIEPMEEKRFDYLKGIHKKFRKTLIISIILSIITFIVVIFLSEPNIDEALFTLVLWLFIAILVFIRVLLPLFGVILCRLAYKKTNKKVFLVPLFICVSILCYSLIDLII